MSGKIDAFVDCGMSPPAPGELIPPRIKFGIVKLVLS